MSTQAEREIDYQQIVLQLPQQGEPPLVLCTVDYVILDILRRGDLQRPDIGVHVDRVRALDNHKRMLRHVAIMNLVRAGGIFSTFDL